MSYLELLLTIIIWKTLKFHNNWVLGSDILWRIILCYERKHKLELAVCEAFKRFLLIIDPVLGTQKLGIYNGYKFNTITALPNDIIAVLLEPFASEPHAREAPEWQTISFSTTLRGPFDRLRWIVPFRIPVDRDKCIPRNILAICKSFFSGTLWPKFNCSRHWGLNWKSLRSWERMNTSIEKVKHNSKLSLKF